MGPIEGGDDFPVHDAKTKDFLRGVVLETSAFATRRPEPMWKSPPSPPPLGFIFERRALFYARFEREHIKIRIWGNFLWGKNPKSIRRNDAIKNAPFHRRHTNVADAASRREGWEEGVFFFFFFEAIRGGGSKNVAENDEDEDDDMMMMPNKIVRFLTLWTLVLLFSNLSFTVVFGPPSATTTTKKRREERDVVDDGVEEDVEKA